MMKKDVLEQLFSFLYTYFILFGSMFTFTSFTSGQDWVQWRGPHGTAVVEKLPATFPTSEIEKKSLIKWTYPVHSAGLGGISATEKSVIFTQRDVTDSTDIITCLNAETGQEMWTHRYSSMGNLDYGNSIRATPIIDTVRNSVYILNPQGELRSLDLGTGKLRWRKQITVAFMASAPKWGYSASPLLIENRLFIFPGGREDALVALNPVNGEKIWSVPGKSSAYATFVYTEIKGVKQLIGYDEKSLGGWNPLTGEKLWELTPPHSGDFNVPTPVVAGNRLILSSERNGVRLYDFTSDGKIISEPVGTHSDFSHDTHTPVVVNRRVYGTWGALYALNLDEKLKIVSELDDDVFQEHTSILASDERLLITGLNGQIVLVDITCEPNKILGRIQPLGEDSEVYSHPAMVKNCFYIRDGACVMCLDFQKLQENNTKE